MKRWRDIIFNVLVFLLFIWGLSSGVFYYALWSSVSLQERLATKIGELYGEKFWLYALSLLAGEILFFLIAYVLSLESQRPSRPQLRLYLSVFSIVFPALALYAGSLGEELFSPPILALLTLGSLLLPASLFLAEWLAGRVLLAAGKSAYVLRLWAHSQQLLKMTLCFSPQNTTAKKYYALNLFQREQFDTAENILSQLYDKGKDKSPELLKPLLHIYEEKKNLAKKAELLEILHYLEPANEEWRLKLIEVMEEMREHRRAIELLEEKPDYRLLSFIVRLERLYAEIEIERARELCKVMAELEGAPFSQSLLAYRQLLQKAPEDIDLLEAVAGLCLKANYLDEASEYMEKVLQLQPQRADIRERLIGVYREGHQYHKLKRHLEFLVLSAKEVPADLMAEYIETLIHSESATEAEKLLSEAKASFPVDYRFPKMLAEIYYERREYEEALGELTKALALIPEEKGGQLTLLKQKIQGALLNKELEETRNQVEAEPDNVDLRFKYIEKLTANAYVEKAAAELDQLLYFRPELKEQAMSHLTKLCEDYGRTFLLLNYLADLYLKDKNYEKVLDLYQIMAKQSLHPDEVLTEGCKKILKLCEDFEPAWRRLAELQYKSKNWLEAEKAFQHCLEFKPVDGEKIYLSLFEIYWQLNEFNKLSQVGELAIKADPYNVENYKRLARALMRLERFQEALQWLMQAKNIDTHDDEIFKLIRQADDRNKEERLLQLKDLVQKFPDNAHYHFELAELLLYFERLNEAILHYQKAAQLAQIANLCKAKLALCLVKKGMHDLAEETVAEVKLSLENETELREIKSVIYDIAAEFEKEKLKDKALKYYKEVFRVDAGFRNVVEKIEKLQASPFPWGKV